MRTPGLKKQKCSRLAVVSLFLILSYTLAAQHSQPLAPAEEAALPALSSAGLEAGFDFFLPNAFTPDGDGLNDSFLPKMSNAGGYVFTVYDRWGKKLFETRDPDQGWDGSFNGSLCEKGVYVYEIGLTDLAHNHANHYAGTLLLFLQDHGRQN